VKKPVTTSKTIEKRFLACATSAVHVEYRGEGEARQPAAFVGKAIVCNSRSHNLGGFVEVIDPKALDECDLSDVVGLFNHNRDLVLGRTSSGTLTLTRDADGGLSYRIAYDPTDPDHQRVMAKILRGDVVGSSFAFRVAAGGDSWDKEETDTTSIYVRTVTKISKLGDVGPVTVPAYAASTAAKRSLDECRQRVTPPPAQIPLSVRKRQLQLLEAAG
jgi:HK97 family phage prohead protease